MNNLWFSLITADILIVKTSKVELSPISFKELALTTNRCSKYEPFP